MLLSFNDRDIAKLGIYDSVEYINRAVEEKEKFEILVMASGGVLNPAEMDQYGKYFHEPERDVETTVEEDMKVFKEMSKVLAGMNER